MTYYVGTMPVGEHLSHHGIKGMKWGQRRYQNPDGSLTAAGRARYGRYMQRAAGARSMASQNRAAARRTNNRVLKGIYNINDAYYTTRARKLTDKANRVKRTKSASNSANRRKTLRKVGIAVGAGAAAAGATYLGMRYGKGAARKAGKAFNVVRSNFNQKRAQRFAKAASRAGYGVSIPGKNDWKKIRSANVKNAFKKAGSAVSGAARKASGATSNAFRGVGYQARRTGAKAKNAARNLGYMAGNVKGNARRAASKAGTAAKNAAYRAGSKAKTTATKAKNTAKNAKNIPGNAKRVAYNLKNNKAYRVAAGLRAANAAYNVGAGAVYYKHARRRGASKGAAATIGAARTFGGSRAGMYAGGAHVIGTTAYRAAKRYNSPSAKRARARRKKSRK